jgi:hypothetical protein
MSECISVVLPVYEEGDNIAKCLRGLGAALLGIRHEILVVYDFEEDSTLPAIEAMSDCPESVRLVRNDLGRGAANALRAGFAAAEGDVVVTTMADLSDPPEVIPRLADKLLKRTMSRAAGLILRTLAGLGTHDATSNFRAYSKRFLDDVTLEAAGGFEIALELTVKAHLAGRPVDEVPSSWVDRSAGESRFRLWAWLPHYIGWFTKAAAAPAAAWLVLGVLLCFALAGIEPGPEKALELARVLGPAALGAAAIVVARRTRGRNTWIDVVHGLAWLPPAQDRVAHALGVLPAVLVAAVTSTLAIALTTSAARRSATWAALREHCGSRASQATLTTALLGVLLWISRAALPGHPADDGLDPGWEQALGYGLTHGFQWGEDLVFTFGPLGYFNRGRFDPDLFWTKVVWWEFALKAVVVVFYMTAFVRIRGALSRTLFYLAVLLPISGHDTFWFIGVACIALWCLEREDRGSLQLGVGLFSIALMGLVKFTVFVYAGFAVLLTAAVFWRRRSPGAGLSILGGYGAAVAAAWMLCGQQLAGLPAFVKHSYWIAKNYTEGQSLSGPAGDVVLGGVTFLLCALTALLFVAARPWRIEKLAGAGLVLAVLYFAGKSGFTRHGENAIRFFTVAAAVPFLLYPVRGAKRIRGHRLRSVLCWAIFGLSMYGYHSVLGHGRDAAGHLFSDWTAETTRTAAGFLDIDQVHAERVSERKRKAARYALPRLREEIGDSTVDLIHNSQGVLFLNELNYRPRPIFQSYQVNSPQLLALNRALYEGERAPEFVLFDFDTTDNRFPNMEDNEVHQVLMRDYEAVDFEHGYLLLKRRPDAPRGDRREVIDERVIGFDQLIDVPQVGPGEILWVELEFGDRLLGRLGTTLAKSPMVHVITHDSTGVDRRFRIAPGITPSGLLVTPFPTHVTHWARWFAQDGDVGRVETFSVSGNKWARRWWKTDIKLRFVRRPADLDPPRPGFRERALYSMLVTAPDEVVCDPSALWARIRGVDVLAVSTPSELRYTLAPGRYHATGQFGVFPKAFKVSTSPPVRIQVLQRNADGDETVLFEEDLDVVQRPADRRLKSFHLEVDAKEPLTLVMRAEPLTSSSKTIGEVYWIQVGVLPNED